MDSDENPRFQPMVKVRDELGIHGCNALPKLMAGMVMTCTGSTCHRNILEGGSFFFVQHSFRSNNFWYLLNSAA